MKKMRFVTPFIYVFLLFVLYPVVMSAAQTVTVVNFDDLPRGKSLTGTSYAGLTWEMGNIGWDRHQGSWIVPDKWYYSQTPAVINYWGCSLLGVSFPGTVNILGADFVVQGSTPSFWTSALRFHGYRNGVKVAVTPWFEDIDTNLSWIPINLTAVDRMVVESSPTEIAGGWYAMDNLTYTPEPASLLLLGFGGLLIKRKR